jgi:hypothetical protein
MHTWVLQLAPSDPGSERRFDFSDSRWRKSWITVHARSQNCRALWRQTFLLGSRDELKNIVRGICVRLEHGTLLSFRAACGEAPPHTRSFFHFFAAGTLSAGSESKIGERASDG